MSSPTQQDPSSASCPPERPVEEQTQLVQPPSDPAGPEEARHEEQVCPPTPPSPCSGPAAGHLEAPYLNDLPSLTPSKLATSVSDSDSDSIPERFTDDDEDEDESDSPAGLLDALSLVPSSAVGTDARQPLLPPTQRTPSSQTSLATLSNSHISLSEPAPIRNAKMARKRSLSALVALRYRGGKGDSEIGDEERGLLALDLDTYINSGEPEIPETRALPPSALFPTLSGVLPGTTTTGKGVTSTRRYLCANHRRQQQRRRRGRMRKGKGRRIRRTCRRRPGSPSPCIPTAFSSPPPAPNGPSAAEPAREKPPEASSPAALSTSFPLTHPPSRVPTPPPLVPLILPRLPLELVLFPSSLTSYFFFPPPSFFV